jgi:hypothetical protein
MKSRYNTQFWGGPGSPVILVAGGEINASRYPTAILLETTTTPGVLARKIGAAVLMLEHRYWGTSSPYADQTTANLQYLTLSNAMSDHTNFAQNVDLPFDTHGRSNPLQVPWVLIGGSYSGALTAWIAVKCPGTFWAYLGSSAVVETISDFWQLLVARAKVYAYKLQ